MGFETANWPWPLLPSAARTATTDTPVQDNPVNPGAYFLLRVTVASGTGGLRLRVMLTIGGVAVKELNVAPPAITTTGDFLYLFKPSALGGAANLEQICGMPLPDKFIVRIEHLDGSSYTYQLDEVLLV